MLSFFIVLLIHIIDMFFIIFLSLVSIPLWLHIYDGYKQNDIKRGIVHIISFFILIVIFKILIKKYGIWLAISIPPLFFVFIFLIFVKNKYN